MELDELRIRPSGDRPSGNSPYVVACLDLLRSCCVEESSFSASLTLWVLLLQDRGTGTAFIQRSSQFA